MPGNHWQPRGLSAVQHWCLLNALGGCLAGWLQAPLASEVALPPWQRGHCIAVLKREWAWYGVGVYIQVGSQRIRIRIERVAFLVLDALCFWQTD